MRNQFVRSQLNNLLLLSLPPSLPPSLPLPFQLLGVSIRADMPIALDLLPCFWKSLKGEILDLSDLREADCITYNLTQKMLEVADCEELDELLCGLLHGRGEEAEGGGGSGMSPPSSGLKFVFTGLDGRERELCPAGRERTIS